MGASQCCRVQPELVESCGGTASLLVWRIVQGQPQLIFPFDGDFHVGDCYIVRKRLLGGARWNVHLWLGREATVDERFVAAKTVVELADLRPRRSRQFREEQGAESAVFLSYFPSGITYVEGGVDTFLRHVAPTERRRLLMVYGSNILRVKEVPLQHSSLKTHQVFILDAKNEDGSEKVFFWYVGASQKKISKGIAFVQTLRDCDYMGRPDIIRVVEDPHNTEFWNYFGGEQAVSAAGDLEGRVTLLRISGDGPDAILEEVESNDGVLRRSMLNSRCVYLLDLETELFVWVGKDVSHQMRTESRTHGKAYLFYTRRASLPMHRVVQGTEDAVFRHQFDDWDPPRTVDYTWKGSTGITKPLSADVDITALTRRKLFRAPSVPLEGDVTIWRVEKFELERVPDHLYGHFYSGDSYVVTHEFESEMGAKKIIYYWQGRESSSDETSAAAMQATTIGRGHQLSQVIRVRQGREPQNFRALFQGHMVVRFGGTTSGYKNKQEEKKEEVDEHLFQVKGTDEFNTFAVEVPLTSRSLNSGDCFILVTEYDVTIWKGRCANEEEVLFANGVASELLQLDGKEERSLIELHEGDETRDFWRSLGGKQQYAEVNNGQAVPQEARLYQCTDSTGVFSVQELSDACQEDLEDESVVIVDCGPTVYVWMGTSSSGTLQDEAVNLAHQLIAHSVTFRNPETTAVIIVASGTEPLTFTQHFIGWDADLRQRLQKSKAFSDPLDSRPPVFQYGVVREDRFDQIQAA